MSVPVRVSTPGTWHARARSQACARWHHALQQRVNVEDCYRVDDQEVELARVGDRTEAPGYLAAQQVTEEVDDLQDTGQQKPYRNCLEREHRQIQHHDSQAGSTRPAL
jgi:hypothetical protein